MTRTALRLSGPVLMGGAALLGLAVVMVSLQPVEDQVFSPTLSLLLLGSAILLLLSLPGMYARQAEAAGWLGLAGHALLQAGMVMLVLVTATPLLHPSLAEAAGEHPVLLGLGLALTLGLLLTGIATTRAGVFPRWAGRLLLAATAGFFFAFFIAEFLPPITGRVGSATFGVLLALALAGIGYALLTGPAS